MSSSGPPSGRPPLPPRLPDPQQLAVTPPRGGRAPRRRRSSFPASSMEALGVAGAMLATQVPTPIHKKLQASLGSEYTLLPAGDTSFHPPPEEESGHPSEEDAGDAALREEEDLEAGIAAAPATPREDEGAEEEEVGGEEQGEGAAADDELDATRVRGTSAPAAPSPVPMSPAPLPSASSSGIPTPSIMHGSRPPSYSTQAPPPPLFPSFKRGGTGTGSGMHGHAHAMLPPILATMTPLSSKPIGGSSSSGSNGGSGSKRRLGAWHVFWTSAETMWGVLIFLRFGWCVGQVGLVPTLGAVLLSAAVQALCASSLSAVATNGLVTRSGGAYYMILRSLGLGPGASIGCFYYLGMTALMAVELFGFANGAELLVRYRYHHVGGKGSPEPHIGEPPFTGHSDIYWDRVLLNFIGLAFLLAVRLLMQRKTRHRVASAVVLIFFLSLAACCGGVLAALATDWLPAGVRSAGYPRPSDQILWRNLLLPKDKVTFDEFRRVLSIVYPSFIGIFQGANLCSELKRPFQAIPRGTFGSVLASALLYSLVFLIAALAAPASILRSDEELLLRYAWPTPLLGYAGTMAVGLISALSCFEVSPRILQSLAEDRAIRFLNTWELNKLYSYRWREGVPVRAILVTGLVAVPFMFLPSIELVARAAAVCFLTMYASMNVSCLMQSALQLHTWRPAFRYYSWATALAGTLLCLFMTFYLDGLISLLILALALALFLYIELRGDVTIFGHGMRGLKYHIALTSLYGMEESMTANALLGEKSPFWRRRQRYQLQQPSATSSPAHPHRPARTASPMPATHALHQQQLQQPPPPPLLGQQSSSMLVSGAGGGGGTTGYWRPQILVYLHATELKPGGDISRKRQLLAFVGQLKATRGLTIAATVVVEENLLEGIKRSSSRTALGGQQSLASLLGTRQEEALALKKQIMADLAKEGILGFAEAVSSPDLRTGLSMLLQLSGLGGLRPNTCVMAWPNIRRLTEERALRFLEFIARAAVNEKAVLALKLSGPNVAPFPASTHIMRGPLDVWWLLHDGGILILVAYLLQRHVTWRHCTLRLFTVVQGGEAEVIKTQLELTSYLHALRIDAEVHVVGLELQDMGEYSEDWTVRRKRTEGPAGGGRSLMDAFTQPGAASTRASDATAATTATSSSTTSSASFSSGSLPWEGGGVAGTAGGDGLGPLPPPPSSSSSRPKPEPGPGPAAHIDEGSKIQQAILSRSRDSTLVLINLPPPPKSAWVDPIPYFRLVESLTGELSRVVLVYGSGAECLSTYI